jgi:hypothetical protein
MGTGREPRSRTEVVRIWLPRASIMQRAGSLVPPGTSNTLTSRSSTKAPGTWSRYLAAASWHSATVARRALPVATYSPLCRAEQATFFVTRRSTHRRQPAPASPRRASRTDPLTSRPASTAHPSLGDFATRAVVTSRAGWPPRKSTTAVRSQLEACGISSNRCWSRQSTAVRRDVQQPGPAAAGDADVLEEAGGGDVSSAPDVTAVGSGDSVVAGSPGLSQWARPTKPLTISTASPTSSPIMTSVLIIGCSFRRSRCPNAIPRRLLGDDFTPELSGTSGSVKTEPCSSAPPRRRRRCTRRCSSARR